MSKTLWSPPTLQVARDLLGGGALGGAINYIHYTGEKEGAVDAEGRHGRRASIVTHGRRSSVAVQVKRASISHGEMVIEEEQKGNPILL